MEISYPDSARRQMAGVELESPWFAARNRIIADLTACLGSPRHLVDVGAGNGTVALHLEAAGIAVTALEPSSLGAEIMRARGLADVRTERIEDAAFPHDSVEAVGMFDVIEHVEEPTDLLQEVYRVLIPGGVCLVTVPALPSLWSDADEFAGHFRRYTRSSLTRELEQVGFASVVCEYRFASALVPLVFLRVLPYRIGRNRHAAQTLPAVLEQVRGGGGVTSWLLDRAFRTEHALARRVHLPFGTSVVGGFVKPRETP